MNAPQLDLTGQTPLAKGGGRLVYAHPDRADLIVKVPRIKPRRKAWRVSPSLGFGRGAFGPQWNTFVEVRELARATGRVGHVSRAFAAFGGFINTTLGAAALFDAIRADTGDLAPTLRAHAEATGLEDSMEQAITALWDRIEADWLVVSDRALVNCVVTGSTDKGYDLTLIDGIGERTFVPLKSMSRRIHARKCAQFCDAMLANYRTVAGA
ncbi:YrbL family protein [Pseudooctadecabacter sp.]|uniref:YrbL family protein n=1 Tax=Pseudooctadecabacter sp. TaxID=1966338 RepID=UPI0025E173A2|nr:YrbL family protein [Pseudooctadecabacter sp.]